MIVERLAYLFGYAEAAPALDEISTGVFCLQAVSVMTCCTAVELVRSVSTALT